MRSISSLSALRPGGMAIWAGLFFVLLATPGSSFADSIRYTAGAGSKLVLNGDSTLHKYACVAQQIKAEGELQINSKKRDVEAIRTAVIEGKMSAWTVRIPVAGLKSEHSGLDENLQKAMRADQFPEVTFKMTSYKTDAAGPDNALAIKAQGVLTVAGKSRNVSINGLMTITENGFTLSGKKGLLMSEYSVEPPVLFMGTVKTDDKVEIQFNLNMLSNQK